MPRTFPIDVMFNDRFVATLRIPTYLADGVIDGLPMFTDTTLMRIVEQKLPTLRNKPYTIHF